MTLFREIPFSAIQFPLYEYAKVYLRKDNQELALWKVALCGSFAGGVAAGIEKELNDFF